MEQIQVFPFLTAGEIQHLGMQYDAHGKNSSKTGATWLFISRREVSLRIVLWKHHPHIQWWSKKANINYY